MNGRCTSYTVSGNVCYNFKNATGFSLEMGPMGAHVYNNLVFNGTRSPFIIYNYPPPDQTIYNDVFPRDMTDSVVEYNTFIVPEKIYYSGAANGINHNVSFVRQTPKEETDIFDNTIRNNIFVNSAGGSGVLVQTTQATYTPMVAGGGCTGADDYIDATNKHSPFRVYGKDPTTEAKTITLDNNVFFSSSVNSILALVNVTTAVCGTPIVTAPADVGDILTWSEFEAFSTNYSGNVNVDPKLADNDADYYNTPGSFDFRLTASSPTSVTEGAVTSTVTTDITGAARGSSPSIGAFQYGEVTQTAGQCNLGSGTTGNLNSGVTVNILP